MRIVNRATPIAFLRLRSTTNITRTTHLTNLLRIILLIFVTLKNTHARIAGIEPTGDLINSQATLPIATLPEYWFCDQE